MKRTEGVRSGGAARPHGFAGRLGMTTDTEFGSLETEMNRGFLQVLVLVALERRMYGYAMIRLFEQTGYAVEENTLYPLLRRLEKNGWIRSEWDVGEDRPKKFYVITKAGAAVRERALTIWAGQNEILTKMREANRHA
jgi:PadR family transcriptional regulator PadR